MTTDPTTALDRRTFNWTDLVAVGLVGFDGEDLGIKGLTFVGNLVEIDRSMLHRASADTEPCDRFRSITGDRWALSSKGLAAVASR